MMKMEVGMVFILVPIATHMSVSIAFITKGIGMMMKVVFAMIISIDGIGIRMAIGVAMNARIGVAMHERVCDMMVAMLAEMNARST